MKEIINSILRDNFNFSIFFGKSIHDLDILTVLYSKEWSLCTFREASSVYCHLKAFRNICLLIFTKTLFGKFRRKKSRDEKISVKYIYRGGCKLVIVQAEIIKWHNGFRLLTDFTPQYLSV